MPGQPGRQGGGLLPRPRGNHLAVRGTGWGNGILLRLRLELRPVHKADIPGRAEVRRRDGHLHPRGPAEDLPVGPGQGGQQHPLPHALAPGQHLGLHRTGRVGGQLLQIPRPAGEGHRQNQLLLGPGHGHIEQPQLLGHHLQLQLPGHRPAGQGGILHPPLHVQPLGAHPQLGVEQDGPAHVLPVEPPRQPAEEHHGELQPLRLVDAQDAHAAPLPAGGGQGQLGPVLPQPGQVGQKAEQALVARALEAAGQLRQGEQIGLPLLPPVHCAEHPQQIGAVVELPEQLVAAQLPRAEAQLVQLGQKGPAVLPPVGGQGGVEVGVGTGGPELRQPVGGEAVHRGAEDGDEGHVLPWVVHDLEQGEGHVHLCGGEEVAAALRLPWDVPLPQGAGVVVEHRVGGAE